MAPRLAESPLGGLTASGIHLIDAFVALGGPVGTVTARSRGRILAGDADVTDILLDFDSGATGYIATVTVTAPDWRLQAFCSEGWAEHRHPGRVAVRKLQGEAAQTEFTNDDGVRAELEAFAEAVAGARPYPVTLDQAVHGTDIMEAVIASASTGTSVHVERTSL